MQLTFDSELVAPQAVANEFASAVQFAQGLAGDGGKRPGGATIGSDADSRIQVIGPSVLVPHGQQAGSGGRRGESVAPGGRVGARVAPGARVAALIGAAVAPTSGVALSGAAVVPPDAGRTGAGVVRIGGGTPGMTCYRHMYGWCACMHAYMCAIG